MVDKDDDLFERPGDDTTSRYTDFDDPLDKRPKSKFKSWDDDDDWYGRGYSSYRRSYYNPGVPDWARTLPPTPDIATFFSSLSALDGHNPRVIFDGKCSVDMQGDVHLPHLHKGDGPEARLENMAIAGVAVHERAHLFCDTGQHFFNEVNSPQAGKHWASASPSATRALLYKNVLNVTCDIADEARLVSQVPATEEFLEVKQNYSLLQLDKACTTQSLQSGQPSLDKNGNQVFPIDSTNMVAGVLSYAARSKGIRDKRLLKQINDTLKHMEDTIELKGYSRDHVKQMIGQLQSVTTQVSADTPARPAGEFHKIFLVARVVAQFIDMLFPDLPTHELGDGEGDGEGDAPGEGTMPGSGAMRGDVPGKGSPQEVTQSGGTSHSLGHVPPEYSNPPRTLPAAHQLFRRHVREILTSRAVDRIKWDTTGRLTLDRPANLYSGGKVFRNRIEAPNVDTAVALLLDNSGSMSGIISYAGALAGGLGCAIKDEGVEFQGWAFDDRPTLVKDPKDFARISARGGTDAPRAMEVAIRWLLGQSAPNKLLIMFTDGDTGGDIVSVNALIRKHNIRLLAGGLNGMDVERISKYFPGAIGINCDSSNLYSSFTNAIRRLLKTTL